VPQRERVGLVGAGAELFQAAWVSVGGVSNSTDYSDWLGRHVYHHSHVAGVSGVCVVSGVGMGNGGWGLGEWGWGGARRGFGHGDALATFWTARVPGPGRSSEMRRGGQLESSSGANLWRGGGRVRIGQVRVGQVAIAWKCAATKHELSR